MMLECSEPTDAVIGAAIRSVVDQNPKIAPKWRAVVAKEAFDDFLKAKAGDPEAHVRVEIFLAVHPEFSKPFERWCTRERGT